MSFLLRRTHLLQQLFANRFYRFGHDALLQQFRRIALFYFYRFPLDCTQSLCSGYRNSFLQTASAASGRITHSASRMTRFCSNSGVSPSFTSTAFCLIARNLYAAVIATAFYKPLLPLRAGSPIPPRA